MKQGASPLLLLTSILCTSIVGAELRKLGQTTSFHVAVGFHDQGPSRLGSCTENEIRDIQREMRYFIRKRAHEYLNMAIELDHDIKEDPNYLEEKRLDAWAGRSNHSGDRHREMPAVFYPWGGSGEFECTDCLQQGKQNLRRRGQEQKYVDTDSFQLFMTDQLTEDMRWVFGGLRERAGRQLDCLGHGNLLMVVFELSKSVNDEFQ